MVRVTLHAISDLADNPYARLHIEMKKEGFEQVIEASTGKLHLPPAEYRHPNVASHDEALKKAMKATAIVDSNYGIVVMGDWITSVGLKPVS